MIKYVWVFVLAACGGDDPSLGIATFSQTPPASDDLFTVAWAQHTGDGWNVYTFQNDEEVHCSEALDIGPGGTLQLELSEVSNDQVGDVPVDDAAIDPEIPSAHVKIGSIRYTAGILSLTTVGDRIGGTFEVTETNLGSTAHGEFNAPVCE